MVVSLLWILLLCAVMKGSVSLWCYYFVNAVTACGDGVAGRSGVGGNGAFIMAFVVIVDTIPAVSYVCGGGCCFGWSWYCELGYQWYM